MLIVKVKVLVITLAHLQVEDDSRPHTEGIVQMDGQYHIWVQNRLNSIVFNAVSTNMISNFDILELLSKI